MPAHIYIFPFEPNPEWSAFRASGVVSAMFDEGRGKWDLRVKCGDVVVEDVCDVLTNATRISSQWHWPDIKGIDRFKEQMMHSACWDNKCDFDNKRIAAIGNGSSAIQIFPELVPHAKQLTNFVRSPTWIVPGLGSGVIEDKVNHRYTEEEKNGLGMILSS